MNVSSIEIDKLVLEAAIKEHINFLIERKKNPNKFSKFDSDNDAFLGSCGEFGFAKYLSEKGFSRTKDYFQINRYKNNELGLFKEHFKEIDGILYDKYDFILDIFYDGNGCRKKPLKIDVKTQKYVGKYNENWQFAVNSNTVEQIKKDPNKIDSFLFIFSKNGLSDVIDEHHFNVSIDELELLKNNIIPKLKKTKIELEILGMIEPSKFLVLSEEFKKGDVFRVNETSNGLNSFKAFSPMYRINLKYLSNPNKMIIPKKVMEEINVNKINNYIKKIGIETDTIYCRFSDGKNEFYFPFNKIYTNSQHNDFKTFISEMFSNDIQYNHKRRKGFNY